VSSNQLPIILVVGALYNLPWRASVSSIQVQCNNPPLRPYFGKTCTSFLTMQRV